MLRLRIPFVAANRNNACNKKELQADLVLYFLRHELQLRYTLNNFFPEIYSFRYTLHSRRRFFFGSWRLRLTTLTPPSTEGLRAFMAKSRHEHKETQDC